MPPNDNITETGQGYHALYHNIQVRRAYGYGVVQGGAVSPGSDGGLSVDVSAGTALHNETVEDIPSNDSIPLASADSDDPRKDLVVYSGGGTVEVVTGNVAPIVSDQDAAGKFETYQPSPPDGTGGDYTVLAEVWVAPGATTIQGSDINDLRTDPAAVRHGVRITDDVVASDGTALLDESGMRVADGRVDTAAIQDDAVTAPKIAGGAVGSNEIAQDAVSPFELDRSADYNWTGDHTFQEFNTVQTASEYLTGDGTANDAGPFEQMVEDVDAAGGGLILLEQPDNYYNFDTQVAPVTTGNPVVILGVGRPRMDFQDSVHPAFDFQGSPNVTLKHLHFTGDPQQTGINFTIRTGDGFQFFDLFLDGGGGGINMAGENIRGEAIRIERQHDQDNGWSSSIHASGTEFNDVYISGIVIRDCDRAIESEDGAENITYENGWIENIYPAGSSGYTFVLDVHRHDTAPDCRNITYRNFKIQDVGGKPFGASNHSDAGVIENVTFENIDLLDNTGVPLIEADRVTVRDIDFYHPSSSPPSEYLKLNGGHAVVEDVTGYFVPASQFIKFDEGDRIEHDWYDVRDIGGDAGNQQATRAILVGGGDGLPYARIQGFHHDGTFSNDGVRAGDGALAGTPSDDDFVLELVSCRIDAAGDNLNLTGTNGPVRLQGGTWSSTSSTTNGNSVYAYGVASPDPSMSPTPMGSVPTADDLPDDAPSPSVLYVEDEGVWYTYDG